MKTVAYLVIIAVISLMLIYMLYYFDKALTDMKNTQGFRAVIGGKKIYLPPTAYYHKVGGFRRTIVVFNGSRTDVLQYPYEPQIINSFRVSDKDKVDIVFYIDTTKYELEVYYDRKAGETVFKELVNDTILFSKTYDTLYYGNITIEYSLSTIKIEPIGFETRINGSITALMSMYNDIVVDYHGVLGGVEARVYSNYVVALTGLKATRMLYNDGSDGSKVVEPYKSFILEPGEYYYKYMDKRELLGSRSFYANSYIYMMVFIGALGFSVLAIIMYSYSR